MEGFTFYRSFFETVEKLPEDDRGEFCYAIAKYAYEGIEIEFSNPYLAATFVQTRDQIERSRKRSQAGKTKTDESKQESNANQTQIKTESNGEQDKDKGKGKDKDKDKEIGGAGEKRERFTPPSIFEIDDYCKEKGFTVDAATFIAFYESKGWMVGKNKMKNWKAALSGWHSRNAPKSSKASFAEYDLERKSCG